MTNEICVNCGKEENEHFGDFKRLYENKICKKFQGRTKKEVGDMKLKEKLLLSRLRYINLITELHKHLELDLLNKTIIQAEDSANEDFKIEKKRLGLGK